MTTIRLPMPPSLNNLFPTNRRTGGRFPSKKYALWQTVAGWELKSQHPPKIKGPVRLEYLFEEAGTKADLSNLDKAVEDLLVTHEVIEGDRKLIVRHISMRWALGIEGCHVTVVNLRPQEAAELEHIGDN